MKFFVVMIILGLAIFYIYDKTKSLVVSDQSTSLMWQIEPFHQPLDYVRAGDRCTELELMGFDDWRLPTIRELRTIVRGCSSSRYPGSCRSFECSGCPANGDKCYIDDSFDGPCGKYWAKGSRKGYRAMNFTKSSFKKHDPIAYFHVRCVRTIKE